MSFFRIVLTPLWAKSPEASTTDKPYITQFARLINLCSYWRWGTLHLKELDARVPIIKAPTVHVVLMERCV